MARRTSTAVAVLCGGGPADGERRPVDEATEALVVHEPPGDGPVSLADAVRAHRYERRTDGRFVYVGPVERLPELPDHPTVDPRTQALAALRHDPGPSALAITAMIVVVAVVMACIGLAT